MTTEPTSLRLDVEAKKKAYKVFAKVGLKPAQAFNLFLRQVALRGGIPFDIKVPNAETIESMEELASGGGKRYKNSQEMYDDLGI
ncbi:MAG: type II toxin-antitoxin system RelB/DinJ family antitoxin [Candidatus Scalindua sp.]|nr:type II toxin-antitoxin system RelB/DinJ family antitoxin [Candidatus Scalindua sp.]